MDIKLKNRHKISALLYLMVIAGTAAIMVCLYPFFESEAERSSVPAYQDHSFLSDLVSGNYVLYLEQYQNRLGVMASPFDLYFPGGAKELKEGDGVSLQESAAQSDSDPESEREIGPSAGDERDYLLSLKQDCMTQFDTWNMGFGKVRNFIDYQMLGPDGSVLINHAGNGDLASGEGYVFKAVLHYDGMGRMEVGQLVGEGSAKILDNLQKYGQADPMEDDYGYGYNLGGKSEFVLSKPQDVTFVYAMTEQQLLQYGETGNATWRTYYESGMVEQVFAGLAVFAVVLAFLFSCFDVRWAEDNRIFRVPFELVACVSAGGMGIGYSLTSMVAATNQGSLYSGLMRAEFIPQAADIMIKCWNGFWWCIPFAIIYWGVLCMRDVFHIGVKRYLLERTLCGLFLGWCARMIRCFCRFIGSISLQDTPERAILKVVGVNFLVLAILCSLWFFGIGALLIYTVVLFFLLRRKFKELSETYERLLKATRQLAQGNLDAAISDDMGVFEPFKAELQKIQSGFKVAVDEEVKSQKMKTDLITNMSHDLKTPLTAIITYVNLLKDETAGLEQRKAYIDVLEQKSMRLKSLIEDLFEISKASSNDVTLNLVNVDIVSLLKEVSLELGDKIEESTIHFRWDLPDEKIVLPLDSQKTYRIFDNLLTNIIKYAMPGTRAYIAMKRQDNQVVITMRNVSASELRVNPKELTERFVRGDAARNTEGSGLGLAIAKSFVELQNGTMEVGLEADLFRITIRWPVQPLNSVDRTDAGPDASAETAFSNGEEENQNFS